SGRAGRPSRVRSAGRSGRHVRRHRAGFSGLHPATGGRTRRVRGRASRRIPEGADPRRDPGLGEQAPLRPAGGSVSAHTENSMFVAGDIDFVWTMTNDLASWPDLFTEYASVDILERDERRYLFRLTMHPDENGAVWSWVSERILDPEKHRAVAHRVETG